jgi:hypothetical protein
MRTRFLLVALLCAWAAPLLGAQNDAVSVNPFQQQGNWYRGNTHTHTTESDGKLAPAARCASYREAGYDFVVISDHNKVTDVSGLSDDEFLAIAGAELHPANPHGGSIYHFVAINLRENIDAKTLSANEVIAEVKRQGGEVVLAHPYWSGHAITDYLPLQGYLAVEVYNHVTDRSIRKGYSEQTWDELLDRAGPVFGIAADDAHGKGEDSFHGWIMVKAPALTTEAVMAALRTGAFYATEGPQILDLEIAVAEIAAADPTQPPVERRVVRVKCSPAKTVVVKGPGPFGRRVNAPEGQHLTEAELILPASPTKYVRIEITDADGKKAWSNPLFF